MRWLFSLEMRLRWGSERVNSVISNCSTINNYWIDNIQTIVMYSLNSASYCHLLNSFHIHFLRFSIYLIFYYFSFFSKLWNVKLLITIQNTFFWQEYQFLFFIYFWKKFIIWNNEKLKTRQIKSDILSLITQTNVAEWIIQK